LKGTDPFFLHFEQTSDPCAASGAFTLFRSFSYLTKKKLSWLQRERQRGAEYQRPLYILKKNSFGKLWAFFLIFILLSNLY
jgi:hypothetical protein